MVNRFESELRALQTDIEYYQSEIRYCEEVIKRLQEQKKEKQTILNDLLKYKGIMQEVDGK